MPRRASFPSWSIPTTRRWTPRWPARRRQPSVDRVKSQTELGFALGSPFDESSTKSTISELNLAFQIEDARALHLDSIADQPAQQFSPTRGSLKGAEFGLVQSLGPIRSEHAMCSTCHRILGNAFRRGEVATHKIVFLVTRRSHDYSAAIHCF